MSALFTTIGRVSVRWKWLVVLAWIVVTFLAVRYLPSIADVAKDTTSGFLPANSPSMQAAALAAPFQAQAISTTGATSTIVAARDGGLTPADNAAFDQLVNAVRAVPRVMNVIDLGIS